MELFLPVFLELYRNRMAGDWSREEVSFAASLAGWWPPATFRDGDSSLQMERFTAKNKLVLLGWPVSGTCGCKNLSISGVTANRWNLCFQSHSSLPGSLNCLLSLSLPVFSLAELTDKYIISVGPKQIVVLVQRLMQKHGCVGLIQQGQLWAGSCWEEDLQSSATLLAGKWVI